MQTWTVRKATLEDIDTLQNLIVRSARGLNTQDYTPKQVESVLKHAYGVDPQLVQDGTYFVVLRGSTPVACGGWSKRKTVYEYDVDHYKSASTDTLLDPVTDAAHIRAFFVDPAWARKGLGSQLMQYCIKAAQRAGFKELELLATLTGQPLYIHAGFKSVEEVSVQMPDGISLNAVRMTKDISM